MTKTRTITFAELRDLLEKLGYRHERVEKGEVFRLSDDRELYYRRYSRSEAVNDQDLASTRRFLDAWGQVEANDFDAFVASKSKPA
jgi:hypothetical protein